MQSLGSSPLSRRRYLSRAELAERHGARAEDVEEVRRFGADFGLTVTTVALDRRTVKLRGAPSAFEKAFGIQLAEYQHPRGTYRSHDTPLRVPAALASAIVGVFGLDTRPLLRPHFRRGTDPAAAGLPIPTVGAAYAFPSGADGTGVTVGLLEFGGGYATADLQQFFGGLTPPANPTVLAVGVDGATNAPAGDPNGDNGEVELDIEMVGALAPGAKIVVYFAPGGEQGFVDALTTAMHDTANAPAIVSISWGGPEPTWSQQGLDAFNQVAEDAAQLGVTVLAAAGDQGASDGEPPGTLAVDFPASSPNVVACGGTELTLNGTSIVSEVVWNELAEGDGATGGGVSQQFGLPSYQSGVHVPPAPNGSAGRGVPDVAGNADPVTGYAIVVDGQAAVVGGTSAVAPLYAALFARYVQSLGKPLGFVNPLLYAPAAAGTFRPITTGNNDGYSAGPGWNPCTGLGSPNGSALRTALQT